MLPQLKLLFQENIKQDGDYMCFFEGKAYTDSLILCLLFMRVIGRQEIKRQTSAQGQSCQGLNQHFQYFNNDEYIFTFPKIS